MEKQKDIRFLRAPERTFEEIFVNGLPIGRIYDADESGIYKAIWSYGGKAYRAKAKSLALMKVEIRLLITK